MERRQVIKNLTGIAALAFLPKQHLFAMQQKKPIHFIGLGKAGTKVLNLFHERGLGHYYTAITDPERVNVSADVKMINYRELLPAHELREDELFFCDPIDSSAFVKESKEILKADHKYVLLGGLGGFTTSRIGRSLFPLLQQEGKVFQAIFSRPFIFEGKQKMNLANEVLVLANHMPQIHHFDNDIIRTKFGNLGIREAFRKLDEEFVEEWKKLT